MIYVVYILEVIALFFVIKLWRRESSLTYKMVMTIITLIPGVGLFFYFFIHDMPTVKSIDNQHRGARGTYTQRWQLEREKLAKKIEELEKEVSDDKK